jgi:carboxyl-terminal processing protease
MMQFVPAQEPPMHEPFRRVPWLAVAVLSVGGILGGLLGDGVQADARDPDDGLWTFGRVLALVEDEFVGEVDSEALVEDAIAGLLGALDPHSNYLSPESFADMRDEQRGRFHGLGIQITKRGPDKPLTIIAPIDGTPASRAGLQSGDIISEIEGEPTIDLTVQQAVRRLKGDKGTKVTITVQRPGSDEAFPVTIERDEIPIQSVRVSYMVAPNVGVIRIGNFNNTTAEELDQAIEKLRAQGMQRLILDLRGNPGGLLDQAVEVAERFIPEGELVVYTRGRIAGSNQRFTARKSSNRVDDVPLVVLVDRSSASASEIVSGAVQDHDRGLVVGETTFGKGLVQRVIPIQSGDGGAVAVTTAKYYTPSGRLIQRDYSDLDDYYLNREEDAELPDEIVAPAPSEIPEPPADQPIYYTTSGREVHGGGGITPDYVVKTPEAPDLWFELIRENLAFDFAVSYVAAHPDLARGFPADEAMTSEFEAFLAGRAFEYAAEEFAASREEILRRVRAQIARIKWNEEEEALIRAETDPQIQHALEVLDEAERLRRRATRLEEEGHHPGELQAGAGPAL